MPRTSQNQNGFQYKFAEVDVLSKEVGIGQPPQTWMKFLFQKPDMEIIAPLLSQKEIVFSRLKNNEICVYLGKIGSLSDEAPVAVSVNPSPVAVEVPGPPLLREESHDDVRRPPKGASANYRAKDTMLGGPVETSGRSQLVMLSPREDDSRGSSSTICAAAPTFNSAVVLPLKATNIASNLPSNELSYFQWNDISDKFNFYKCLSSIECKKLTTCKYCGRTFFFLSEMLKHLVVHKDPSSIENFAECYLNVWVGEKGRKLVCGCRRSFKYTYPYAKHVDSCVFIANLKCQFCGYEVNRATSYVDHFAEKHSEELLGENVASDTLSKQSESEAIKSPDRIKDKNAVHLTEEKNNDKNHAKTYLTDENTNNDLKFNDSDSVTLNNLQSVSEVMDKITTMELKSLDFLDDALSNENLDFNASAKRETKDIVDTAFSNRFQTESNPENCFNTENALCSMPILTEGSFINSNGAVLNENTPNQPTCTNGNDIGLEKFTKDSDFSNHITNSDDFKHKLDVNLSENITNLDHHTSFDETEFIINNNNKNTNDKNTCLKKSDVIEVDSITDILDFGTELYVTNSNENDNNFDSENLNGNLFENAKSDNDKNNLDVAEAISENYIQGEKTSSNKDILKIQSENGKSLFKENLLAENLKPENDGKIGEDFLKKSENSDHNFPNNLETIKELDMASKDVVDESEIIEKDQKLVKEKSLDENYVRNEDTPNERANMKGDELMEVAEKITYDDGTALEKDASCTKFDEDDLVSAEGIVDKTQSDFDTEKNIFKKENINKIKSNEKNNLSIDIKSDLLPSVSSLKEQKIEKLCLDIKKEVIMPTKKYLCRHCEQTFDSKNLLKQHKKQCEVRHRKSNRRRKKKHAKREIEKFIPNKLKFFNCKFCKEFFRNEQLKNLHLTQCKALYTTNPATSTPKNMIIIPIQKVTGFNRKSTKLVRTGIGNYFNGHFTSIQTLFKRKKKSFSSRIFFGRDLHEASNFNNIHRSALINFLTPTAINTFRLPSFIFKNQKSNNGSKLNPPKVKKKVFEVSYFSNSKPPTLSRHFQMNAIQKVNHKQICFKIEYSFDTDASAHNHYGHNGHLRGSYILEVNGDFVNYINDTIRELPRHLLLRKAQSFFDYLKKLYFISSFQNSKHNLTYKPNPSNGINSLEHMTILPSNLYALPQTHFFSKSAFTQVRKLPYLKPRIEYLTFESKTLDEIETFLKFNSNYRCLDSWLPLTNFFRPTVPPHRLKKPIDEICRKHNRRFPKLLISKIKYNILGKSNPVLNIPQSPPSDVAAQVVICDAVAEEIVSLPLENKLVSNNKQSTKFQTLPEYPLRIKHSNIAHYEIKNKVEFNLNRETRSCYRETWCLENLPPKKRAIDASGGKPHLMRLELASCRVILCRLQILQTKKVISRMKNSRVNLVRMSEDDRTSLTSADLRRGGRLRDERLAPIRIVRQFSTGHSVVDVPRVPPIRLKIRKKAASEGDVHSKTKVGTLNEVLHFITRSSVVESSFDVRKSGWSHVRPSFAGTERSVKFSLLDALNRIKEKDTKVTNPEHIHKESKMANGFQKYKTYEIKNEPEKQNLNIQWTIDRVDSPKTYPGKKSKLSMGNGLKRKADSKSKSDLETKSIKLHCFSRSDAPPNGSDFPMKAPFGAERRNRSDSRSGSRVRESGVDPVLEPLPVVCSSRAKMRGGSSEFERGSRTFPSLSPGSSLRRLLLERSDFGAAVEIHQVLGPEVRRRRNLPRPDRENWHCGTKYVMNLCPSIKKRQKNAKSTVATKIKKNVNGIFRKKAC